MKLNNKELQVGQIVYVLVCLNNNDYIVVDREVESIIDDKFTIRFCNKSITFNESNSVWAYCKDLGIAVFENMSDLKQIARGYYLELLSDCKDKLIELL